MNASRRNQTLAFTLSELLATIVIVAPLVLVLLPALVPAKKVSKIGCVNNLKQVELTFRIWAGDINDRMPMAVSVTNGGSLEWVSAGLVSPHFQVMSNELNTPKVFVCPLDGERQSAANCAVGFAASNVSYFVCVAADDIRPNGMLSGDRNVTLHGNAFRGLMSLRTNDLASWTSFLHTNQGNIGLADASVEQVSSKGLRELLMRSGVTHRLVFP